MANLKGKWKLWIAIGVLVVAIFGTIFGVVINRGEGKDKVTVIRVGSTAPGHVAFVLNRELRFWESEFAKDGITVTFDAFSNGGSEVMTALANGNIDLAYTGADPPLRGTAAGMNIVLIGFSVYNKGSGVGSIGVRTNSPIQSVADLKGKKIAFLSGTVRHASLGKALAEAGLSLNDIEGLNIAFEASAPALIRGDIDALVEMPATIDPLIESGEARLIFNGRQHTSWVVPNLLTANGDFARKHPDIVKRFLKVGINLARWSNENFDTALETFAKGANLSAQAVARDYPNNEFYHDPNFTQEGLDAVKDEEKFLLETGLLTGSIDYDKWVLRQFIDDANKEVQQETR